MREIKNEIKKVISSLNNPNIKFNKSGIIIPIYYGYDDDDNIFFDVDSIRDDVNLLLDKLDEVNVYEDE
jgi:hypothetical protein